MIQQSPSKDHFQQSTSYPTSHHPSYPSLSQLKSHLLSSKLLILQYVTRTFNALKNHIVRSQISKINSSYTFKPIQKQGIDNLASFVQKLQMFYKNLVEEKQLRSQYVKGIVNWVENVKRELGKQRDELQSDSQTVRNVERVGYIVRSTFEKLLECLEVRDLTLTDYLKYVKVLECLLGEVKEMVEGDDFVTRIGYYNPYSMPTIKPVKDTFAETVKSPRSYVPSVKSYQEQQIKYQSRQQQPHHHPKQLLHFNKPLSPYSLDYIFPTHHRLYVSQASKAYSAITPIRVNKVNIDRFPRYENYDAIFDISNDNYFQGQETVPIVYHLVPGTNDMSYYNLETVEKVLNITKEFENIKEMPIDGKKFTEYSQSCITPYGSVFMTNITTTDKKYDTDFYQYKFNTDQIKKRVSLPSGRKQHGMVFLNNAIYLIGGSSPTSKALKTVDRYNIKTKQWVSAGNMQVGVTNPTVCSFRNRFIFSMCGLNEFDFISNRFQVYDSVYDGWSIVKTITNPLIKSLQLLNGGSAVAINEQVIYVFGGNRGTGFQQDGDLALMINEVLEVKKKPSRVVAEIVPTGGEKRGILSFAGLFKGNSGVVHNGSLYFVRKGIY